MLTKQVKEEIIEHSKETFPLECCGIIVHNEDGYLVQKCQARSEDYFVISASEMARAELRGQVLGIYHSHTNGRQDPSDTDFMASAYTGLPWHIYEVQSDSFCTIPPKDKVELLGRQWSWKQFDCFSLVRDTYKQILGIEIPDFERGSLDLYETDKTWNKFRENIENAGFRRLGDHEVIQDFDMVLMSLQSPSGQPNHCGIITDASRNRMYHHIMGRLSQESIYGGYYQECTLDILRLPELDTVT